MGKDDGIFLSEKLHVIENKSSSWEYETYCDLRDLAIGKRMFVLYGSARPVKRDPLTDVR